MKASNMHGQGTHLKWLWGIFVVVRSFKLIPNPLAEPHSHVYVILEVPVDLARPQVVDHVKFVIADDEVVAQRARNALTCGSTSVLGKPHRQERLARERFTLQEVYNVLQIAHSKAVSRERLPGVINELVVATLSPQLACPEPLHVVVVVALLVIPLVKGLAVAVVRPAMMPVPWIHRLTCYSLLEMTL